MKINNIFRKSLILGIIGLTMTSCSDFLTITPTDKTVLEDYWKSKDDVDMMVNGAYKAALSGSFIERCIVWGDFRSDELNIPTQATYNHTTSLKYINTVNLLPSNEYCSWAQFYKVINDCNIVLKHAPGVMELDPEFTEGDYKVARSQMLALRSLCYFYLVRAFRDVPYSTESYESDDQDMIIPQASPDSVLANCIKDLEEAEQYSLKSGAYGTTGTNAWKNKGYITKDAIDALLADIYLWRASMKHSAGDYQKCVDYCTKVIDAKIAYHKANSTSIVTSATDKSEYPLETGTYAFQSIFCGGGNSEESIFELQFDGTNNSNTGVRDYYTCAWNYSSNAAKDGCETLASKVFSGIDVKANIESGTTAFATTNDYRYMNDCYTAGTDESDVNIRKMVATEQLSSISTTKATKSQRADKDYQQNWIVYRLSDVMLMDAEARVQLATTDSDKTVLQPAFNLVKAVNDRSLIDKSKDSLKFADYSSKASMEILVLAERQRELSFEGKRWFDLVRYNYRHVDGIDMTKTLANQNESGAAFVTNYSKMLSLITRKYTTGGDAIMYKLKNEAYLYFPISTSELKVNNLLKQNPVYIEEETISKN